MRIRIHIQRRQIDLIGAHVANRSDIGVIGSQRSRLFRTLRINQTLRKYSALTVVLASVFLVATNNISTRYQHDNSSKQPSPHKETSRGIESVSMYNSIAILPHLSPSTLALGERDEEEIVAESYVTVTTSEPTSAIEYLSSHSFVTVAQAMERDPEMDGGVKLYTVQDGDTVSSIANKFNITINTLYWANNINDIDEIMPGDTLFILPIAGLKHIVKEGDDLSKIAEEYKADRDQIIAFNELPANGRLEEGQELIIPGAEKDLPEPEPTETFLTPRQYAGSDGKTVENRHGKPNRFPYGYCTWYVAQQKYVPWRGNAGTWLYNAKSAGYATGSKAKEGAIVVTTDNTYYGHVALVTDVSSDTITIKEMNYKGWGVVNTRTISKNDRKIKGYIY